ncbi:hypothetical protein [Candidatus Mycosynbacter amalyticus]|nr:hypothetical protein [Candidatus Mycosynbacter amalyticus]
MQPQNQQYPVGPDSPGYPGAQPGQPGYPQQMPGVQQQVPAYSQPVPAATPQYYPQQPGVAQQPSPVVPGYPQQMPGVQQQVPAYSQPVPAPTPVAAPTIIPDAAVAPASGKQQSQTPAPRPKNTTQNTLLFSEIRDNMVIMADGSFRAVIACKSINFDLMSSREREGVEFSYQNFINSLTHPVQILIRSQRVDIGPYLDRLVKIRKTQDNMLLGVLMDDYIEFIEILSEEANIMDKSFYVVVPFSPTGDLSNIKDAGKGFFAKMFGPSGGGTPNVTKIDKITYEKARDEIKNRVDSVTSGLFQMGVHCTQLTTKELGELYYNYYNPDTAVREPLGNFQNNTFTYVRKGQGEAPRPSMGEGIV